jgi:integrase
MPKRLTAAAVRKYRAKDKRREIPDALAPGLRLLVQSSGVKSWVMRFRRPDGKPAKLTLGRCDLSGAESQDEPVIGGTLTLGAARQLANKIQRERARGVDVVEEHKATKLRQRAAIKDRNENSFGAAVREFFVDYKTKWGARPRRWKGDAAILGLRWPHGSDPATTTPEVIKGSLAHIWADKPVATIDGHDVHVVVSDARKHGIPGLEKRNGGVSDARGRKLHAALSVLFRWLVRQRRVPVNPAFGVWRPGAGPARERALNDSEIRLFWVGTDMLSQPHGAVLKLLLLTGCRLKEVLDMRWEELGDDGSTWTIPGSRTKNHRTHVLSLPPMAFGIIASTTRIEGNYVFTTTGHSAVGGWSKIKRRLDEQMLNVPPWRIHDLRRTAASGMQQLGVRVEIIERALNHVSGSFAGVAGIYQRDPMTEEVRAALLRWSQHVSGLIEGTDKVVALEGRRA